MAIDDHGEHQKIEAVEHDHTKSRDFHSSGLYYLTLQVGRLSYNFAIVLMTPSAFSHFSTVTWRRRGDELRTVKF